MSYQSRLGSGDIYTRGEFDEYKYKNAKLSLMKQIVNNLTDLNNKLNDQNKILKNNQNLGEDKTKTCEKIIEYGNCRNCGQLAEYGKLCSKCSKE